MAEARLLAKVAVEVLVANVPVVELVQALEPLVPAVNVPQVKIPLAPPLSEKVVAPTVVEVTVTVFVEVPVE
jgi:hypothetical protein